MVPALIAVIFHTPDGIEKVSASGNTARRKRQFTSSSGKSAPGWWWPRRQSDSGAFPSTGRC